MPSSDEMELLSSTDSSGIHLHQQDKDSSFRHTYELSCDLDTCNNLNDDQDCSGSTDNIASTRNIPSGRDEYYDIETIDSKDQQLLCCQDHQHTLLNISRTSRHKQSIVNMFENPSCTLILDGDDHGFDTDCNDSDLKHAQLYR